MRDESRLAHASRSLAGFRIGPLRAEHLLIAVAGVAASFWFIRCSHRVTSPGFPLDDAWIHLQFARNLASGHGFTFNPGVHSGGSTAPLWVLLLALPACWPDAVVPGVQTLGIALALVTALAAARLGRLLTGHRLAALVAGMSVALSPRLTWGSVSGMEVPLAASLTTLAICAYLAALRGARSGWWAAMLALAGGARPEALALFPILLAYWMWSAPGGARGALRGAIAPCGWLAAALVPYLALNQHIGHEWLPSTYYAKSGGQGLLGALIDRDWEVLGWATATDPITFADLFLHWAMFETPFVAMGLFVGVLVAGGALRVPGADTRGSLALVAVLVVVPALRGALVPTPSIMVHEGRYISFLLPLFFAISAMGFAFLWTAAERRWMVAVLVVVALGRMSVQDLRYGEKYAAQVQNMNDLEVAMGHWVAAHTAPGALIATNDIGAIAYFGGRTILDTQGLVTPEVVPYWRAGDVVPLLATARPDLAIVFPSWHPEIARNSKLFREIGRISAPMVIAGGSALVIYITPWTRPERLIGVPGPAAAPDPSSKLVEGFHRTP